MKHDLPLLIVLSRPRLLCWRHLQAGGCYLPLDCILPPERLAFMLKESRARVLLTHNSLEERLPEAATPEVAFSARLMLAFPYTQTPPGR